MSDYQNNENKPNTGALFQNKYKEEGDSKPDWTGPFTNERGDDMRVGIWFRTSKAGNPYIHVEVSEKQEKRESPQKENELHNAFNDGFEQAKKQHNVEDNFFG
jgi:hypothetical protein